MLKILTPDTFHEIAVGFSAYRWRLILWSAGAIALFVLLEGYITATTPGLLMCLLFFILFFALQSLICAAFIFFFLQLRSQKNALPEWQGFYRFIEWSETCIFTVILPCPIIIFIYGSIQILR